MKITPIFVLADPFLAMLVQYTVKKGIRVGAVSGAIAGAVMMIAMMATSIQMGLPADVFPALLGSMMGQGMGAAVGTGVAMHMLASILIGIIFGAVTSVSKLRLTNFGKGIGLGVAAGMISFGVLFLPMMMTVLPPQMMSLMQMMNPDTPSQMIMQQIQAIMPMMIGSAVYDHVVYGAVLGAASTAILSKSADRY